MSRAVTLQTNFTTGEIDPLLKSRIDMRIRDFREQYPSKYQIVRTLGEDNISKFMVSVYWGVVKKVDGGWRCWFVDGLKVAKEKYGETND